MRKRLVYRADDVGYTEVFDLGIYKSFEEGVATSADVMFDAPHAKEALLWLKERPWISVGWHRHLWESPILPACEVPSLVDEEGRFKWRHNRMDLMKEATYEDAYKEFCAEAEFCKDYLGRYPDTAGARKGSALEDAYRDVLEKYGIAYNFWGEIPPFQSEFTPADEKWQHLNFRQWPLPIKEGSNKHSHFDLAYFKEYDPLSHLLSVKWADETEIWRIGGHPGFLDDHILSESSCSVHRIRDLQACTDARLKEWIIENKIELINQRDVLYGTNEFQDHLKEIDSPLWIGNM